MKTKKRKKFAPVKLPVGRYRIAGFNGPLTEIVIDSNYGLTITRLLSPFDYTQKFKNPWKITGTAGKLSKWSEFKLS